MKCPKCGYLGFETSDRCRNCGYDFSLAVHVDPPPDLLLHQSEGAGAPLADFTLGQPDVADPVPGGTGCLDLDRLIGVSEVSEQFSADTRDASPAAAPSDVGRRAHTKPPVSSSRGEGPVANVVGRPPVRATMEPASDRALPLFSPSREADDPAQITPPRPAGPPLSVRRATPDAARGRSRSRVTPRREAPGSALVLEPSTTEPPHLRADLSRTPATLEARPATAIARLVAMLIDVLLLGAIDGAVLYFTLAIAGLTINEIAILPRIPLGAFLLLLNGGYLVAFTAASGQTIGKMVTGICVIGDDARRVDVAGAVLRAGGCTLSLLTLGLGYLPAFFTASGRALQDRVAGTRVVSIR